MFRSVKTGLTEWILRASKWACQLFGVKWSFNKTSILLSETFRELLCRCGDAPVSDEINLDWGFNRNFRYLSSIKWTVVAETQQNINHSLQHRFNYQTESLHFLRIHTLAVHHWITPTYPETRLTRSLLPYTSRHIFTNLTQRPFLSVWKLISIKFYFHRTISPSIFYDS